MHTLSTRAPKVGEQLPDFSLPNAEGKEFKLSTPLQDGPVILTFYRGSWCPYCNIQLREYQKFLPKFKKAGAQLVAVSPYRLRAEPSDILAALRSIKR